MHIKTSNQINWVSNGLNLEAIIKGKKVIIDTKNKTAQIEKSFTIKAKTIEELKEKVATFLS